MKKVAVIDSEVESQRLEGILREREIPYFIKSYHDSAYDGLFQSSRGWGHVETEPEYEQEVLDLLDELR